MQATEAEQSARVIKKRKSRGRSVVTTSFCLPPELAKRMKREAEARDISLAAYLRRILEAHYKKTPYMAT